MKFRKKSKPYNVNATIKEWRTESNLSRNRVCIYCSEQKANFEVESAAYQSDMITTVTTSADAMLSGKSYFDSLCFSLVAHAFVWQLIHMRSKFTEILYLYITNALSAKKNRMV